MSENRVVMSATRMQMYLTCKYKYYCNYVLHLPRKPNVSFKLGIAVHEALAKAGEIWQKNENFTKEDVAIVKDLYNKVAAKEGIADTTIYHDGLNMVLSRLDDFAFGKILTVEDKFTVTTDDGVMITGAMDKVLEMSDNTVLVVDYKTSKYFETEAELKSDIQLSIYDAVANIKYPNYKRIILSLDYLRGAPVYTYRTESEREGFLNYMLAIYEEMLKFEAKDAMPMINDMCNWCDFNDQCEAYKTVLDSGTFMKKKPEEYDDDELVKEYLDIKSKKRILDNRERQFKGFIMDKIQSEEQDVVGNGKHVYIRQNSYTVYDPRTVFGLMSPEDFFDVVSVSKKAVDERLNKYPAGKAILDAKATKNYTSPFVAYKTLK